jgi:CDP-glucose 4,6-dehydratase
LTVQLRENLARTFSGRKVFLTGHTGFKGSWLAAWLTGLGAEVTGFSLPGEAWLFDRLGLAKKMHDVRGDIRDRAVLARALTDAKPDFVFHLAAQALVRASYHQPLETYAVNAMGTAHLLEACRALDRAAAVVCITTDKCYRNDETGRPYEEDDPLGGRDPYSASKAAAEIVIGSYRDSFFPAGQPLRVASARAGNVIGGGDWAGDRLVPDAMRALRDGKTIRVRNPDSTRPWQHVLEPVGAYLVLAAALAAQPENHALASAFNFGPDPGANRPVRDLVEEIVRAWPGRWESAGEPGAPHEAGKLNLAIGKAARLLGWQPIWNFEQTVRHTVDWYRREAAGEAAAALTREQIENYVAGQTGPAS